MAWTFFNPDFYWKMESSTFTAFLAMAPRATQTYFSTSFINSSASIGRNTRFSNLYMYVHVHVIITLGMPLKYWSSWGCRKFSSISRCLQIPSDPALLQVFSIQPRIPSCEDRLWRSLRPFGYWKRPFSAVISANGQKGTFSANTTTTADPGHLVQHKRWQVQNPMTSY